MNGPHISVSSKQQVYSSIYESLLLKDPNFETGKEIWDALKKEQEEKSNLA